MKAELEKYGYFIIHKSLQMPGVTVCPEHVYTVLHEADYSRLKTIKEIPPSIELPYRGYCGLLEFEYDIFCADFIKAEFDFSMDTIADLMDEYLPLKGESFEKRYSHYIASIKKPDDETYGHANINVTSRFDTLSDIRRGAYIPSEKSLAFLFNKFFAVSDMKRYLPEKKPGTPPLFTLLTENNGYTLLGEYRDDVVSLRHNECGTIFAVSPYGFRIGWRCPVCERFRTPDEQLAVLTRNLTADEYKPVSPFETADKPVAFHHSVCGRDVFISPRRFLYEGIRCTCRRDSLDENFAAKIRDLTGTEYSLAGPYVNARTRVEIRHNVCGRVHDYKPSYFLDGARCPFCTPKNASQLEFVGFVKKFTSGRYVIVQKADLNCYAIKDTVLGKVMKLTRPRIMQELTRPTESPLLPFPRKPEDVGRNNLMRMQFRYSWLDAFLKRRFPSGGIIYWDEVIPVIQKQEDNPYTTTNDIYGALTDLVEKGMLKKLTMQYYCFPDEDYRPDEVIIYRYLIHDGHRIGFARGAQFAEDLGLLPSSEIISENGSISRVWHICTNMESAKTPQRKTKFFGQDIHIKGSPVTITDDIWLILAVHDFLLQYKQIVKADDDIIFNAVRNYIKANSSGAMFSYDDFKPYMNYKTANIYTYMNKVLGRLIDGTQGQ